MNTSIEIIVDEEVIDTEIALAAKMSKYTESPIETMFGLAMYRVLFNCDNDALGDWELIPQFKLRHYRIDWALKIPGRKPVFIECDGREFHTRPDQIERDRKRDAAIRRAGIQLFRFTGSEIYHDAAGCARRVYEAVMTA